jgi:hypothetical protein
MVNLMWDERYQGDDYVYGTSANDFLQSHVDQLPMGRILCLAEGEGRNAVFLAERGFDVTAVDQSSVGLAKAHACPGTPPPPSQGRERIAVGGRFLT